MWMWMKIVRINCSQVGLNVAVCKRCNLMWMRCGLVCMRCKLMWMRCSLVCMRCSLVCIRCNLMWMRWSLVCMRCNLMWMRCSLVCMRCSLVCLRCNLLWRDVEMRDKGPSRFSYPVSSSYCINAKFWCLVSLTEKWAYQRVSLFQFPTHFASKTI
jgi:hypothetical protein